MKIDVAEVEYIVRAEVLKREIVEGDEAEAAQARVSKFYRKGTTARRAKNKREQETPVTPAMPDESITDRLLREAQEQEESHQGN